MQKCHFKKKKLNTSHQLLRNAQGNQEMNIEKFKPALSHPKHTTTT